MSFFNGNNHRMAMKFSKVLTEPIELDNGKVIPVGAELYLVPHTDAKRVIAPNGQSLHNAWDVLSKVGHTHSDIIAMITNMESRVMRLEKFVADHGGENPVTPDADAEGTLIGRVTLGMKDHVQISNTLLQQYPDAHVGDTYEVTDVNVDFKFDGVAWNSLNCIYNRVFNVSPRNENADLVQCNEQTRPGMTWHYKNCVFDCRNIPHNEIDEAFSVVRGANAIMENCVILGAKKAILCGSGDDGDWGGSLTMRNCVLIGCGRRCPEAQQGYEVRMEKCWVHNWGVDPAFDTRAFAAWVHDDASIQVNDCIFTRNAGLGSNDTRDKAEWIGWYTNTYGVLAAVGKDRYGLSGSLRAIEKIGGGNVGASHNYRNQSNFVTGGDICWSMGKSEADAVIASIEAVCPDMTPYLGKTLSAYWAEEV